MSTIIRIKLMVIKWTAQSLDVWGLLTQSPFCKWSVSKKSNTVILCDHSRVRGR